MPQAAQTALADKSTALVVDRDDDTRHMYADFLRLAHCEIEEAADGREALAKAIARPPSVIITEIRLPGIGGIDLCRLLRTDPITNQIPIVVVTADARHDLADKVKHAGADTVLVKPCLPERLLEEIRRVLANSSELQRRSTELQARAAREVGNAMATVDAVRLTSEQSHRTLARSHVRGQTTTPPLKPPELICPRCDGALAYENSHLGGVNAQHSEQWDYFECPSGCGTFQYRHRTRNLRRV